MKEILKSGNLEFVYDRSDGTYSIINTADSHEVLTGAHSAIHLTKENLWLRTSEATTRIATGQAGTVHIAHSFARTNYCLELQVTPLEETAGFSFRVLLDNKSAYDVSGVDFYPFYMDRTTGAALFGPGSGHEYMFLRNGLLTWSHCGVHSEHDKVKMGRYSLIFDPIENPPVGMPRTRGYFIGECVGAVRDNTSGNIIVAGFTTLANQLGQISFKSRGGYLHHFKSVSRGEGKIAAAGTELASEEFVLLPVTGTAAKAPLAFDSPLKTYATLSARQHTPPVTPRIPVGWCSWYYYYYKLNEQVICNNIDAAKDLRDRLAIDIFQVDDGYEPAPGDWLESTQKFPHGIEWMANRIRTAGFEPGLWLAPFFATERSKIFKEHRDWFVKSDKQSLRRPTIWPAPYSPGNVYSLDTTNPDMLRWLHHIIDTIVNKWGYKYIKIDFMYNGAIDGIRYDPTATRAEAFRRGLSTIRDAAGDDCYILGCGIPLGLTLGLVNGNRISGDTAHYWYGKFTGDILGHPTGPGVRNAGRVLHARYFLNPTWGLGDPDCLMCRLSDTKLSRDEVFAHATSVAMTGGPLFISDDLTQLTDESIQLAQRLIPPLPYSAVPVDLFDGPVGSIFYHKFERAFDSAYIFGFINWTDSDESKSVELSAVGLDPASQYHAFDLWADKYLGTITGRIDGGNFKKHSGRIIGIRKVAAQPAVIATTFHFTQGGVDLTSQSFCPSSKILSFSITAPANRKGKVYFQSAPGLTPKEASVNNSATIRPTEVASGIYSIEFPMKDHAEVEIRF